MKSSAAWLSFTLLSLGGFGIFSPSIATAETFEVAHLLTLSAQDGVATIAVERHFKNKGSYKTEASHRLDIPQSATAVTFTAHFGEDHVLEGNIMGVAEARTLYDAQTGAAPSGTDQPGTGAFLARKTDTQLKLKAYPVASKQTLKITYTLTADLEQEDGRWVLYYPTAARIKPKLVDLPSGLQVQHIDKRPEQHKCGCQPSPPSGSMMRLSIPLPHQDGVGARYGVVPLPGGRNIVQLDLEAASSLMADTTANVAFVVDASHSQGDEGVAMQLGLVRGYLAQFPKAKAEVIVYRRDAEFLMGRLLPAPQLSKALKALDPQRLVTGNGSHLDAGLQAASGLLNGLDGPKRIVVFTDGALRKTLRIAHARSILNASQSLVHVVVTKHDGSYLSLDRDDEHDWAPLALETGGILMLAHGDSDDEENNTRVAEELVRPLRIDHLALHENNREHLGITLPNQLEHGEGWQKRFFIQGSAPKTIQLQGQLWGTDWSTTITPNAFLGAHLPTLALLDKRVAKELQPNERQALLKTSGAVTEHTAFLARDTPRQASDGMLRALGGLGMGGVGCSTCCGGGMMKGGKTPPIEGLNFVLASLLKPALELCFLPEEQPLQGELLIETTTDEIVDVRPTGQLTHSARRCIEEAAWALRLPKSFVVAHTEYAVPIQFQR